MREKRDELQKKVDGAEPERQRMRAALDDAEATLASLAAAVRRVLPEWELEKDTAIVLDDGDEAGEADQAVGGEDCVICRDSWTDDWAAAVIWPCGHVVREIQLDRRRPAQFHKECSDQYLETERQRAQERLLDPANMFDDMPIDASLGVKVSLRTSRRADRS